MRHAFQRFSVGSADVAPDKRMKVFALRVKLSSMLLLFNAKNVQYSQVFPELNKTKYVSLVLLREEVL